MPSYDSETYVQSLRALADFLEQHPELGAPLQYRFDLFYHKDNEDATPNAVAHAFGSCEKDTQNSYYILRKKFGCIRLEANWLHEEVCEKVVVGTETVEERVPTAYEIRSVTRDKVEWRCPKVLDTK